MTNLKKLARKKGMRYSDIARELDLKQYQIRDAATTEKGQYNRIVSYLNGLDDTDVDIVYRALHELDITAVELSRRIGEHYNKIIKVRSGYHILYRDIENKIRSLL